jgi:hypothetical protein
VDVEQMGKGSGWDGSRLNLALAVDGLQSARLAEV